MSKSIQLQIVTGMSGSGKTIALHTLEDMGYYCIDNLPVSILEAVALHLTGEPEAIFCKTAVGVDARSQAKQIPLLPELVENMRRQGLDCNVLFLDAQNETLIKRFSETRRKHPLSDGKRSLDEAIQHERQLLEPLSSTADLRIDTSLTNLHELRDLIHSRIGGSATTTSILFESFGFKHGVPRDVDFVFDVRCLPNPHWQSELRPHTGLDKPVADFLNGHAITHHMFNNLVTFFERWIPTFEADGRSYLTIAIGCTGGQHRSVFLADQLAHHFKAQGMQVLSRHRELS
ncbi:MAG: RNase adapter RapZ [Candidatus Thiodiazotropha sp.]